MNGRYFHQRQLLILLMGCKCKYCPERRPWELEFHHLKRPDWDASRTSRHRRIKLWAKDWGNGHLTLACGTCNKKQGQPAESVNGEYESEIPD